jgi:hypothetical protein
VGKVARGFARHIVLLGVIGGLAGTLLPAMALSRDGADSDVRVFHRTIALTQDDLRDPDAVGAAVKQFASSVFGGSDTHASAGIPLSQFSGAMGAQALREKWVSLVLEVWMGGNASPAGYYFRFQGRNAGGDPVQGESFLTSPDEPAKLHFVPRAGLVGWTTTGR